MIDPHHQQSSRRPVATQRSSRLLIQALALVTALAFLTVSLLRAAQLSRWRTQGKQLACRECTATMLLHHSHNPSALSADIRALSAQQALPPAPAQSSLAHQAQQLRRPLDFVQHYAELEGKEYPQECRDRYHSLPYFNRVHASWRQPVCELQVRA